MNPIYKSTLNKDISFIDDKLHSLEKRRRRLAQHVKRPLREVETDLKVIHDIWWYLLDLIEEMGQEIDLLKAASSSALSIVGPANKKRPAPEALQRTLVEDEWQH